MEKMNEHKNKNHWKVNTVKYDIVTVFGIEAVTTDKEMKRNINQLQKSYCKVQNQSKRNRNTFITMVHTLGDGMYHIIVAGFIKRAEFQEYKIPASLYAMVTIRSCSNRKTRKSIQNIEAYFIDKWLAENEYTHNNTVYIFWTKEKQKIFEKNIVDVLFPIE